MSFSLLFSVDACLHTLFTQFDSFCHYRRHRWSARIIYSHCADYLRQTTQLSTAVSAEQPQNSVEKVTFSVSRTVC